MLRPELEKKAAEIRLSILDAVARAGKGHIGGAFSCVEILVSLYQADALNVDPARPDWPDRDRFILSKGHVGVALYAVLADMEFFPSEALQQVNREGMLGEHPDHRIPGVEIASGALGHGLSVGAGMALTAKMDGANFRTCVLLGDGECYEGAVWEAANFAAHHELDQLIAIVDRNHLVVNGRTEEINRLEPLADKWHAFDWHVQEVDGHVIDDLSVAYEQAVLHEKKPSVIIANTVKGKGVSFMEDVVTWHHGGIAGERYDAARSELLNRLNGGA